MTALFWSLVGVKAKRFFIKSSVFCVSTERLYACAVRRVFFAVCCVICSAKVCSNEKRFFAASYSFCVVGLCM